MRCDPAREWSVGMLDVGMVQQWWHSHARARPVIQTSIMAASSDPACALQMPLVPLPPPFQEGWTTPSAAAPAGRSTTRGQYDMMVLLAETMNRGIEEVGGPRWREVLGRSHDAG